MAEQLITFQIADKLLGVDIMAIREIRAWTPTTAIPHAPPFVRGVVNLRGTVLPVIDLSERLGWGRIDPTVRHVIIVLQIGTQLNGLIVDSVNDIVRVEPSEMQAPPELGQEGAERFLEGLIAVEDRMAMVLDLRAMAIGSHPVPLAEAA
jgi:purine-binding chemotaxis protein CheW